MAERVYSGTNVRYKMVTVQESGRQPRRLSPGSVQHLIGPWVDFTWGNLEEGPGRLAMALLAEVIGEAKALDLYVMFMSDIVSQFAPEWRLTESAIRLWVETQEKATVYASLQNTIRKEREREEMREPNDAP